MPSPFPGMDPFLEHPEIWSGFHANLAVALMRQLNRQLSSRYYADVEVQSTPHDIELEIANPVRPDVSIFEPLDVAPEAELATTVGLAASPAPIVRSAPLTIKLRAVRIYRTEGNQLVTSIEILSPYNKRPGSDGIMQYRLKRARLLASHVHLVELDLLRGGERPGLEFVEEPIDTDYILLVNRFRLLERLSEIWPVALNETLPPLPIPLLPPDPDLTLDLQAAVAEVYDDSRYDLRLAYQPPIPPPSLRPAVQVWVENLLAGRRQARDKS